MSSQEALDSACVDLKGLEMGGHVLKFEPAKGNGAVKRREQARRERSLTPNNTLFVVNFDPQTSTEQTLRDEFGKYGMVKQLQINKNYCFVHFNTTEEAERALNALHGSTLGGRQIIVEYSDRSPWSGRRRYLVRDMRHSMSRDHGSRYDRRSPSPRHRRSPSPGYYDRRRQTSYCVQGCRRSPTPPRFRSGRDRIEPYGHRDDMHFHRCDMRDDEYGYDDRYSREYDRREDHYHR
ncbi:uncharacterized protein LOC126322570 isoform X2 [Schistocerca gregaria]|nr:uncharacterized protein LOC126322570 isoform X2 [Schistocerca gregaria]